MASPVPAREIIRPIPVRPGDGNPLCYRAEKVVRSPSAFIRAGTPSSFSVISPEPSQTPETPQGAAASPISPRLTSPHVGRLTIGVKTFFLDCYETHSQRYRSWFSEDLANDDSIIGEGTFGQVFMAANPQAESSTPIRAEASLSPVEAVQSPARKVKNVAIKVHKLAQENFIQERLVCSILTAQKVPHIPLFLTDFSLDSPGYDVERKHALVFEHIPGGDLNQKILGDKTTGIPGVPLNFIEIRLITQQILETLAKIEELNCVHADIKPQNLLFKAGKLYVIDWGSAFFTKKQEDVEEARLLQTRWYRSPEELLGVVVDGKKYRTSAMDMWSLGCALYLMIRSHLLFPSKYSDIEADGESINVNMIYEHLNFFANFLPTTFPSFYGFLREMEREGKTVSSSLQTMDAKTNALKPLDWRKFFCQGNGRGIIEGALRNAQALRYKSIQGGLDAVFADLKSRSKDDKLCEVIFTIFKGCLVFDPRKRMKASEALRLFNEALE